MGDMKENLQVQTNQSEAPNWQRDFVGKAAHEMGVVVARFSIDPESTRKIQIPQGLRLTDRRVAEELGKIDIFDSNLNRLDLSSDQGVFNAGVVAHAKTLALIESTFDTKFKSRLQQFSDNLLDTMGNVIAKVGGKRGLASTLGLTAVLTAACAPVDIVAPGIAVPDGQQFNNPPATEPLPTATARPAETAIPTIKPTETPTVVQPDSKVVSVLEENGFLSTGVNNGSSPSTEYENSSAGVYVVVYNDGRVEFSVPVTSDGAGGYLIDKVITKLYGAKVDHWFAYHEVDAYLNKKPQSATVDGYKLSVNFTQPEGGLKPTISGEVIPP